MRDGGHVKRYRDKETDLENTVEPVSKCLHGRRSNYQFVGLDGEPRGLDVASVADRDPFPLPMPVDRENYFTAENSHVYWAAGHGDWLNFREAATEFIGDRSNIRLLDIACSSGRFLRHAAIFGGDEIEVWGSDLAPANIAWMKMHLPLNIRVFANATIPCLPFPNDHFDAITAFSLFPHIPQFEEGWLAELMRVTRCDGLLYLTIANDATWSQIGNRPRSVEHYLRSNRNPGNKPLSMDDFSRPLPEQRLVRRMSEQDAYNCFVWHSNEFIRREWGRSINIHRISDRAHLGNQAVILARP